MSEYQYYEFLAVDRPLDKRQQAEVRALSTRARITAARFTNEYHWGDFKGDPRRMVERYYDAHLYLANWGTRHLMLRLPRELLAPTTVESYRVAPYADAWTTKEHLILSLSSEDEAPEWEDDPEDHPLQAIIGVRDELTAGDLRPLYLSWLTAYGTWERNEDAFTDDAEDELEPPVPAGLDRLTDPQRALADFLRLDADLLAVAARTSPPLSQDEGDHRGLAAWINELPAEDKDALLLRVAQGQGTRVQAELLRRFRGTPPTPHGGLPRRTVAELLDAAADVRAEHHRRQEAERAAQEAEHERRRALAREKHLAALADDPQTAWARVDSMIETRKASQYDGAVALLKDLHAVAERTGLLDEFTRRITLLRQQHHRKPSLIERLDRLPLPASPPGT